MPISIHIARAVYTEYLDGYADGIPMNPMAGLALREAQDRVLMHKDPANYESHAKLAQIFNMLASISHGWDIDTNDWMLPYEVKKYIKLTKSEKCRWM